MLLDGKIQIYLDVASTMMRAAVKPRIDTTLKKQKSIWNFVPTGSSVVSESEPLGIFVNLDASHIGHRPGNGANLHGRPGPVMIFLSIIVVILRDL